ncbi:MAG: ribosome maturation factor RimP [Acidobacteriota bacterium]
MTGRKNELAEPAKADHARVESAVAELAAPVLRAVGVELDRVEYAAGVTNRAVLRVYIDRPEGVNVEQCAEVSRQLGVVLDTDGAELIPGAHVLEVSSPGLTRPLHGEADFRRFTGRLAHVQASVPIDGKKKDVVGRLAGIEGEDLLLEVSSGERVDVPLSAIVNARLEIE